MSTNNNMNIANNYIRDFLQQRNISSATTDEEGGIVLIFDKRYRVQLMALAHNRIVLRSFIAFLPAREDKKDYFIQKTLRLMQANLFNGQTVLYCDRDQQAIYAQHDIFDIQSFVDLENGLEAFLNAVTFFRDILKDVV